MWSRIQDVEQKNNNSLDIALREHVENMHNVDISLSEKIQIKMSNFKLEDEKQELLNIHMLVSKMVAQLALNRYNNYHYYRGNASYNDPLLQTIKDEDDRIIYKTMIKTLLAEENRHEELLLFIIKRNIIMYLTMLLTLKKIENRFRNVKLDNKNESSKRINGRKSEVNNKKLNQRARRNFEPILEKWACRKCTVLNTFENSFCQDCKQCAPHYNKWRCEQCTMINDKLEDKCQACHQRNPFIIKCSFCKVRRINHKYDRMCEECQNYRYPKKEFLAKSLVNQNKTVVNISKSHNDLTKIPDEKWSCLRCTFINSSKFKKCDVCKNYRPYNNKWMCNKCAEYNHNLRLWCSSCGFKEYLRQALYPNRNKNISLN